MAPKGPASLKVSENALADETTDLPRPVRDMGTIYVEQIERLTEVIERLADELEAASKTDVQLRRLCTIPGIGPVIAGAVAAFAPDLDTFDSGRNFAASCWKRAFGVTLGLVPRQRSTGGKTGLGSVRKMGQTDIRRLLIVGAPPGGMLACACRAVHERHPLGGSRGRQLQPLAGRSRGAQAEDGRGCRAGEQDGPHDLGRDNKARGLPDGVTRARKKGQRHGRAARPG